MDYIIPLVIGYLLDLALGDPRWLPHPVVGFGKMITFAGRHWNHGRWRKIKGCIVALLFPLFTAVFCWLLAAGAHGIGDSCYYVLASLAVFLGLANRSLIDEGKEVLCTLEEKGLEAGRKRLSWIVGRDTSQLTPKEIHTAVLETMSENLSDGVVAPLFYYAIGGFPAMMAYKMVNTLDSMIGYKNSRYKDFGCCAARLDDALNYIPARLTALLMVFVAYRRGLFGFILRNCYMHASPNSGFPESAMAGILNCRFGGSHVYHGELVKKPYIGDHDRELSYSDFVSAARVNQKVTFASVLLIVVFYAL